jgi:hypothetical protein
MHAADYRLLFAFAPQPLRATTNAQPASGGETLIVGQSPDDPKNLLQ